MCSIPYLAVQSQVVCLQSLSVGLRTLELYLKLLMERLQLDIASRHKQSAEVGAVQ